MNMLLMGRIKLKTTVGKSANLRLEVMCFGGTQYHYRFDMIKINLTP